IRREVGEEVKAGDLVRPQRSLNPRWQIGRNTGSDFLHAPLDGRRLVRRKQPRGSAASRELKRMQALLGVRKIARVEAEIRELLFVFGGKLKAQTLPTLRPKPDESPASVEQRLDLLRSERRVLHIQRHAEIKPINP